MHFKFAIGEVVGEDTDHGGRPGWCPTSQQQCGMHSIHFSGSFVLILYNNLKQNLWNTG